MPKDATTKEIKPVESDENVKEKKFIKTVEKECKLREYAWERLKALGSDRASS